MNTKTLPSRGKLLTWSCNVNSNISTADLDSIKLCGCNQALLSVELDITKAFGAIIWFVSNKPHCFNVALREEIRDLLDFDIKAKIADVGSIGWIVGYRSDFTFGTIVWS